MTRSKLVDHVATTYLFVPAHEETKAQRAMASSADALIFDLEASVPDSQKEAGRQAINRYTRIPPMGPERWVRVNTAPSQLAADVEGVDWSRVEGAVVAQAEDPETLQMLQAAGAKKLIPLIETVAGFDRLEDLGRITNVERFGIGTWDLALDLRLPTVVDPDESELIWRLRGDLVLGSRRAGVQPPIDGVHARLNDEAGLRVGCERARRLGYSAKMLIHPRQLAIAAAVFGPDEIALRDAREIVAAYDEAVREGRGVTQLRGKMIDQPVVHRARALLARWAVGVPALDIAP